MFRKKTIFLIISFAMAIPILAAPLAAVTTVPGGIVSGIWDAAGSPYLIEGR